MAEIILDNVTLSFPVLHTGHRSLKKALVATATGGAVLSEARSIPVVQALKGVSLRFAAGDRIGFVGQNGAGKSTLLRVIAAIYEPNIGEVYVSGSVMPLLDLNLGFNGDLTGRENIRLRGMYLGLRSSALEKLMPEIEDFTELGSYLDLPVRTYSSGMQMRLSFGVATAMNPAILLMDEWLMAGDALFLSKARLRIEKFIGKVHILVLASHSESVIRQWCTKAILLRRGEVEAFGSVDEIFSKYQRTNQ